MQKINYIGNQKEAIEAIDTNVCVSAGAGAGKTFVLVHRYIHILKQTNTSVGEIAAITFTDKAASQMKTKIRSVCDSLISSDPERWEKHKHDLENSRIGTIHSFCTRILKEHPIEAGLDPRFRVLDEVENSTLLEKIINKSILNLLNDNNQNTVSLISYYGIRLTKKIIKQLIINRLDIDDCVKNLSNMDDDAILMYWKDIDTQKRKEIVHEITSNKDWKRSVNLLTKHSSSDPSDTLEFQRKGIISLINQLTLKPANTSILLEIKSLCKKTGSKKNWDPSSLSAMQEVMLNIRSAIHPFTKYLEQEISDIDTEAIKITRQVFTLYKKVLNTYQTFKRKEALVDFDDLINYAKILLKENKSIRKLYQNTVKYILVDEFQDTDFHQREIIFYIAQDAAKHDTLSTNKLFIVGDSKQSIYKFRGADVSVFNNTRQLMEKVGKNIDLDFNLRTNQTLIDFLNDFFSKLMIGNKNYQSQYMPFEAKRIISSDTPKLEFIDSSDSEKLSADESREKEADSIAKRIISMTQEEELAWDTPDTPRKTQYKDIAVLFRAMSSINIYEKVFRSYGIPYHIIAGNGFYARQEIKDLLNFLKVLDNTYDDIALTGILRSPMTGLRDDALYWLRQSSGPLWKSVKDAPNNTNLTTEDKEKLSLMCTCITYFRETKDDLSISELISQICSKTGYQQILFSQYAGIQKVSNIEKLIDTARRFETKGIFSLTDFVSYISEFVSNETREGEATLCEEDSNVVKIMTIHKAKGLEFPVVIIPDISRKQNPGYKTITYERDFIGIGIKVKDSLGELQNPIQRLWIDYERERKEIAESKRLFYVATTRAKDYLILSGNLSAGKNAQWSSWLKDHYNLDETDNETISLTNTIKATLTTSLPNITKEKYIISTAQKFIHNIKTRKPLPYKKDTSWIDPLLEKTKPITQFQTKKHSLSATEIAHSDTHEITHTSPQNKEQALELGLKTHEFFEHWDFKKESISQEPQIKEFCNAFINSPIYKEILSAQELKRELPLTFEHNGKIIEGIIDLLYKDKNGDWIILDYKTDKLEKNQIKERAKIYEAQLATYALGLNKILGVTPKKIILLFLSADTTHEIIITKSHLQNIEKQIEQISA